MGSRLRRMATAVVVTASALVAATVSIDETTRYQTIEGLGAYGGMR